MSKFRTSTTGGGIETFHYNTKIWAARLDAVLSNQDYEDYWTLTQESGIEGLRAALFVASHNKSKRDPELTESTDKLLFAVLVALTTYQVIYKKRKGNFNVILNEQMTLFYGKNNKAVLNFISKHYHKVRFYSKHIVEVYNTIKKDKKEYESIALLGN